MISTSLLSQSAPPPTLAVPKASPGEASAFGKLLGGKERQPAAKDGKALPEDAPNPSVVPAKAGIQDEAVAPRVSAFAGTTGEAEKGSPVTPGEDTDNADPIVAVAVPVPLPIATPAAITPAPVPDRPVSPVAADAAIEILAVPFGRADTTIVVGRAPPPLRPASPPVADAVPQPEPTIVVRTPVIAVAPPTLAPVMPRALRPLVATRAPMIALADPAEAAAPLPGAITTIAAITPVVASPALDLTRGDWAATMIDRIERLRDDADAADTSIRVVPDALGRIQVSLRRDDAGTHVHFAADQAQTRALLAEARPQLAELAEARGMRLAQASVGGDAGGQPQHRGPPAAFVPAAPALADTRTTNTTDHRIA